MLIKHANFRVFFISVFLFATGTASGQTYRFTNFGQGSKIPDTFVYTVNQSPDGILWIGTSGGLSRFDGFDFYRVDFPDNQQMRKVTVSYRDKNGVLWFGCDDGSLFYSSQSELKKVADLEIQTVNDIFAGNNDEIFIIPQDKKILSVNIKNPGEIKTYNMPTDVFLSSGCISPSGNILLGTQESLLLCTLHGDSVRVADTAGEIEYSRVQKIIKLRSSQYFLAGTEGLGIFILSEDSNRLTTAKFDGPEDFESNKITALTEDSEGFIWAGTDGNGVYKFRIGEGGKTEGRITRYTVESGLAGETVSAVFQDMEGNKWIGFFGDGLSMLRSGSFGFYAPSSDPVKNNIVFIKELRGKYFLGTDKGYHIFNPETGLSEQYTDISSAVGNIAISSYLISSDNRIFVGTKGNGVYVKFQNGGISRFYISGNSGEDYITNISTDGKNLWLSTIFGVVVLDINTGRVIDKFRNADRRGPNTINIPHNSINQVLVRKDGTTVVATEADRLYSISLTEGVSAGAAQMKGFSKNKILSFHETGDGNIWAGTFGNGIFYLANDSVMNITTANGLFANFCYSILEDSHKQVWIGHAGGISKYNPETGAVKVIQTDFARSSNCNPGALVETSDGLILIGTTEGLIRYNPALERRQKMPPLNNVMAVYINDIRQPVQSQYSRKYGNYSVKIQYVGINLSNPEKVYYSTRLQNLADQWSELKVTREVVYAVRDGKYRFELRSMNEDGLMQEKPLAIDIYVRKPFWRTWWFTLLWLLTAGSVVFLVIRQRDKAQKKVKAYLESELALRTKLVMKQKEELEVQNLEIKDSINYAKRIQSSILPDINKLKDTFRESFILFNPRDIVSGDFYWFEKVNDEKFVIVCADSTGHGVPGAFMSMIGSTLLQDIISRKGITKPSEVLSLLDSQIFSTLNQNMEVGVSNDGMDMVVCEINPKTRHIRFASAMRPVIIVIDSEPYYIKGNRCSVGGESVVEKYFDDQEYYLSEGDSLYLFSDGLPDQFGGVDGKKMKIARLKKLIEDISKIPMSQQKDAVSSFFYEWKGEYEQVDDILVMGIRL
jgi:ligand-binding sensor domain-containing protein/serine phosphatase RsbU (regulator of sigma subunit)